jgi:outer membrane protein OmpA-like peptidoglycan-associated protein
MFRKKALFVMLGLLSPYAWGGPPPPLVDPLIFDDVRFEPREIGDGARLSAVQLKELRGIADELRASRLRVLVVGNADSSEGSESECKAISEARAEFVYGWLSAQGLEPQLTGHIGVCQGRPTGGSTETQRRRNRRVDVIIQKQAPPDVR